MNMQDTIQLGYWLAGRVSLAEVERVESVGLVGNTRFSEQAVRAYRLAWTWTGINFTEAQNRYYERCGSAALDRRIARARRRVNRFMGHNRLFPDA